MAAQRRCQNRPGARGAVLLESFVPPRFLGKWSAGLPAQVHGMADDPIFAGDGDVWRRRGSSTGPRASRSSPIP
ncbi:MAG TPA: hypothetical protein VEX57_15200 [Microlunatus sp.]|nr:hypothetical protein [Microlunatus sp.]